MCDRNKTLDTMTIFIKTFLITEILKTLNTVTLFIMTILIND
jgi:hypothetical protein